ncbi:MAG: hypothetical protein J3K34DRAFT_459468 [Monoraphidium minutum]|nr:MAG: hypothetical protein J3K34DRAFT_459468 [Monoraphidium minutum]
MAGGAACRGAARVWRSASGRVERGAARGVRAVLVAANRMQLSRNGRLAGGWTVARKRGRAPAWGGKTRRTLPKLAAAARHAAHDFGRMRMHTGACAAVAAAQGGRYQGALAMLPAARSASRHEAIASPGSIAHPINHHIQVSTVATMLGDLDLLHMAREAHASDMALGERHLGRLSMDSAVSASSNTSSLSSSWGGFGCSSPKASAFLARQASLPNPSGSAPVNIPGRGARASLDGGAGILRRSSLQTTSSFPFAAAAAAAGGAAPGAAASPPLGGPFAAAAAPGAGAAHDAAAQPRLPALVRSLSRGLSQSLDFR